MNIRLKHTIVFVLIVIQTIYTQAVEYPQLPNTTLQYFDQQRPDNISDDKWFALKTALRQTNLFPTPTTLGGERSKFGESVSIDGNRALVGSPGTTSSSTQGIAHILEFDGNNWIKTAVLKSSEINIGDKFGVSVGLLGNRALIGASQTGNTNSGAAYIFELINGVWLQVKKLTASDADDLDYFGQSVSLSDDRALIGAFGNEFGAAYVFDLLTEDIWLETKILTPSDGLIGGNFGYSVSLSGDRALIGAFRDNDNGLDSGSAYIYELILNNWVFRSKLHPVGVTSGNQFGISVSLSGDRALVGSYRDNQNGTNAGAAYIFDLILGNWTETKLVASDGIPNDYFGLSVNLLGDIALIGAPVKAISSTSNSGAAYVFNFAGNQWIERKISPTQANNADGIGVAVSLSSDRIFIGASNDDTNGDSSGAVYIFDYTASNLLQTQKILSDDSAAFDDFGVAVSLANNRALIGSPLDNENGIANSGSAYIFDYRNSEWQLTSKITANNPSQTSGFGSSVSLLGDLALIGASWENDFMGSVYVFNLLENGWQQSSKLTALDGSSDDRFGGSVNILRNFGGTWAVIGASGDNLNAGAAYTFAFDDVAEQWQFDSKLIASNTSPDDFFGRSISSSGTRVLIGSPGDDDADTDAGAAYIFKVSLSVGGWTQEDKILADNPSAGDRFGFSVSLSGLTGLIGAPDYDGNGNSSLDIGTAYIVKNIANNWFQTDRLTVSGATENHQLGSAVSLSGNRAVINASGIDTAYIFQLSNNTWSNIDQFVANRNKPVSLFGDKILVGLVDSTIAIRSGAARIIDLNILFNDGFE